MEPSFLMVKNTHTHTYTHSPKHVCKTNKQQCACTDRQLLDLTSSTSIPTIYLFIIVITTYLFFLSCQFSTYIQSTFNHFPHSLRALNNTHQFPNTFLNSFHIIFRSCERIWGSAWAPGQLFGRDRRDAAKSVAPVENYRLCSILHGLPVTNTGFPWP